jgi:hypothetical protein
MAGAGTGVLVVRSETGGYTWDSPRHVDEPPGWPDVTSHGAVIELPDGDLLLPVTGQRHERSRAQGMVLRSHDRGRTETPGSWTVPRRRRPA